MGARRAGLEDLNEVWEVTVLKGKPMEKDARELLMRVARQVKPIMRRRGWRVLKLSEFSPRNKSLLGLNVDRGREIRIRLRLPNSDFSFFPYEHVLGTMLHELAHMERGPHDAKFYAFLDELREECESLMAQEIMAGTPEAFWHGGGQRVGGYSVPPTNAAAAAAAAAAQRWTRKAAFPLGAQRLGGDRSMMRALSPVQAAAMAAEQRLHDDTWCGGDCAEGGAEAREAQGNGGADISGEGSSRQKGDKGTQGGSHVGAPGDAKRASLSLGGRGEIASERTRDNAVQRTADHTASVAGRYQTEAVIDRLSLDSDSDDVVVLQGKRDSSFQARKPSCETTSSPGDLESWSCSTCTFRNLGLVQCEMCGTARSGACSEHPQGTACRVQCHARPKEQCEPMGAVSGDRQGGRKRKLESEQSQGQGQFWECPMCTLQNALNRDRCEACDVWRYHRGGPVSHAPAHTGT